MQKGVINFIIQVLEKSAPKANLALDPIAGDSAHHLFTLLELLKSWQAKKAEMRDGERGKQGVSCQAEHFSDHFIWIM